MKTLIKIINYILIALRIRKTVVIIPLEEQSLKDLIRKFEDTREEIISLNGEMQTKQKYISRINDFIVGKLTHIKKGDIIQVRRQNNVNTTFLVNYLLYDIKVMYPIRGVSMGCRTRRNDKHDIEINNTEIVFGDKEVRNDQFSIVDIKVIRNVYAQQAKIKEAEAKHKVAVMGQGKLAKY